MDDKQHSPEALAKMALAFSQTPYGEWLIAMLADLNTNYVHDAKRFTDTAMKLTAIDRAAGITEIADLISGQIMYAENPELFGNDQKSIDKSQSVTDN